MSGVFISNNAPPRIGLNQYARNGLSPVAEFQNMIAERVGYAVRVRAKMSWRSPGQIWSGSATQIPLSSATERTRWRFAAHAAPYAQYLFVRFWQARQSSGTAADCYSRLRIQDGAGTLIGDAVRHFGSSGSGANDNPYYLGDSTIGLADTNEDLVVIPPNAAYFGTFADFNYARLVAACVWEVAFDPDTTAGYPDVSAGSGSPIYDKDRADAATMINKQWAYGAQPLWHWSVDTDAGVRSQGLGDLSGSLAQTIALPSLVATGTTGSAMPTYQAQSALESAIDANIDLAWPAHAINDVAILSASYYSLATAAIATPSGWTLIQSTGRSYTSGADTFYIRHATFWRRADSTSMAAAAVLHPLVSDGTILQAAMTTYRGCIAAGTPYDALGAGSTTTQGPSAILTDNSSGTTVPNALIVVPVAIFESAATSANFTGWTNANLSSVTERFDLGASSRGFGVVTGGLAVAGTIGTTTATIANATRQIWFVIALKP